MSIDSISLFYKEGSSDKEYHVQIEQDGSGYRVNFQYGRRGSSLQSGTKTKAPVALSKARLVYGGLINEKVGKDYTPGTTTNTGFTAPSAAAEIVAAAAAKKEERATGVLPQLLNPVNLEEADAYLEDPAWVMQQKFNGRRMLVRVGAKGEITGINRTGESVGLSKAIASDLLGLNKKHFVIDAESVGEKLHVFDILEYREGNVRDLPFLNRFKYLSDLLVDLTKRSAVEVAPVYSTTQDKRAAFVALRAARAEGVVFKIADSRYVPGRPASGGAALKVKFWKSASVLVQAVNDKRSVSMALLDPAGRMVNVGNVTIPANQAIPNPGAIIEVRYLYAYQGGSLIQTTCLGARDDISCTDCLLSQLIYETAASVEEDASPTP